MESQNSCETGIEAAGEIPGSESQEIRAVIIKKTKDVGFIEVMVKMFADRVFLCKYIHIR